MNKKGLKILLYGGSLWYLGEGMFGPLLAVFTERVGGSVLDISWAWAMYLVFYGVLAIILGRAADHMHKGKMMMWGYGLNALFTFGYLLVSNPLQLLAVQAGLGIAAALAMPTWSALYDEFSTEDVDGAAWGLAGGMASIVTGIAIVVGGFIVEYSSFTLLFIVMGCIQVVATIYQANILRVMKKQETGMV